MISLKNRLVLFWNRLWIRKGEFHKSLNFNGDMYFKMIEEEQEKYEEDLIKRRHIAHEKDLEREAINF